jgi:hypothetical protein
VEPQQAGELRDSFDQVVAEQDAAQDHRADAAAGGELRLDLRFVAMAVRTQLPFHRQ